MLLTYLNGKKNEGIEDLNIKEQNSKLLHNDSSKIFCPVFLNRLIKTQFIYPSRIFKNRCYLRKINKHWPHDGTDSSTWDGHEEESILLYTHTHKGKQKWKMVEIQKKSYSSLNRDITFFSCRLPHKNKCVCHITSCTIFLRLKKKIVKILEKNNENPNVLNRKNIQIPKERKGKYI